MTVKQIDINIYMAFESQMSFIMNEVAEAKRQGETIRLSPHVYSANSTRMISDATIKALMVELEIDEYVPLNKYSNLNEKAKYTLTELNKEESDFGLRNAGKFITANIAFPVIGGGVGASLLWSGFLASFFAGPVGPLAYLAVAGIGFGAFLTVSAIVSGITYLVGQAKEKNAIAQHKADIALAMPAVKAARAKVEKAAEEQAAAEKTAAAVAEVQDYIRNRFDKLEVDLTEDASFSRVKNKQTKNGLQDSINKKRQSLLDQASKWVAENKSKAEIVKIIDSAYGREFCARLAAKIHVGLYAPTMETLAFNKLLESDPAVIAAYDVILNKYEKQVIAQANQLDADLSDNAIIDFAKRERQEDEIAKTFKQTMAVELDAMLQPKALEVARDAQAKADLAAQALKSAAEIDQLIKQLSLPSGMTQTSSNFFETSAATDSAAPAVVVGNGLKQ